MNLFGSFIKNPQNVTFDGQDKDEQIILFLRKHFVVNVKWILILVLLIFAPAIFNFLLGLGGQSLRDVLPGNMYVVSTYMYVLFTFGYFFENFLSWFFHSFMVSTKRVVDIDFLGLINRRFSEAPLRNIEDISNQISGLSQVLFHYGDVTMQTAGEMRELEFENVPNPDKVQDTISDLISEIKGENA